MDEAQTLQTSGSRQEPGAQQRQVAHPLGQSFSIVDAQSVISRDDDGDGYYHRIRVDFDADVASGTAWVYAKLYLSLEGGPWNLYYTTDSFQIEEELSSDAYTVTTRLLDGYPTGYYDVLIELYDADYDLQEVSYGPYEDEDLAVLFLPWRVPLKTNRQSLQMPLLSITPSDFHPSVANYRCDRYPSMPARATADP